MLVRIFAHSGGQFRKHLSHALWCLFEAGPFWILADALKNQANAASNRFEIHRGMSGRI